MSRKKISLKVQLAAALLQIPGGGISHDEAKSLSAAQIRSRFHMDHYPIMVADGGTDDPWNLTWLPVAEHQQKTRKSDVPQLAKGKRIAKKQAAHKVKAAKGNADVLASLTAHLDKAKDGKINYLAIAGLPKIKRAWPKRAFPKSKSKLRKKK